MSKVSRFTTKAVTLAKNAVGGRGESAAPEGSGFADYAVVSLHCLRVYLEKSYRTALDLLSEMPNVLEEIGLETADLPDHSTLVKAFDGIEMALWRVVLCLSAQIHDPSSHAAIDSTFFDRESASKHYCHRTNYRVQTLKATALVDTATQAILDVHCTTTKKHDTQVGWQVARVPAGDLHSLAADKGYDWMALREKLREEGVRPLIKHRLFQPVDHAHNARIDGPRYRQHSMCESVFSTIKRTLGSAVRARTWYREFREIVLMCAVHNIRRATNTLFDRSMVIHQGRNIYDAGNEIGHHGYRHTDPVQRLDDGRTEFEAAMDVFDDLIGETPVGYRNLAGSFIERTRELLAEHSAQYDSSMKDNDAPYMLDDERDIVDHPNSYYLDDWVCFGFNMYPRLSY